jgi:hypothetical protein
MKPQRIDLFLSDLKWASSYRPSGLRFLLTCFGVMCAPSNPFETFEVVCFADQLFLPFFVSFILKGEFEDALELTADESYHLSTYTTRQRSEFSTKLIQ